MKIFIAKENGNEILRNYSQRLQDLQAIGDTFSDIINSSTVVIETNVREQRAFSQILGGEEVDIEIADFSNMLGNFDLLRFRKKINELTRIYSILLPGMIFKISTDSNFCLFYGNSFLKTTRTFNFAEFIRLLEYGNQSGITLVNKCIEKQQSFYTGRNLRIPNVQTIEDEIFDFNIENIFENEIAETLEGNFARSEIVKSIKFNESKIDSEFTDFQAFHICKGLRHQLPLYNRYITNKHTHEDIFKAHCEAMKLLEKYDRNFIMGLLSLPTLPFKCTKFNILFSTLDKAKANNNENPIVRLRVKNENQEWENIEYSFYMENGSQYINQIRVRNRTRNSDLFHINRNGKVICEENNSGGRNKNVTPVLELFYRITENEQSLKNEIINFGVETGNCSICGRILTDKFSILKGIGPICEQYI